jgi:hypothetical protein
MKILEIPTVGPPQGFFAPCFQEYNFVFHATSAQSQFELQARVFSLLPS